MRWFPADLVLVVLFAIAGRASHEEGLTVGGIAHTAWPFVVGLLLGWAVTFLSHLSPRSLRFGVITWLQTVTVAMVLRLVTDAGVALSFIAVAFLVLGVLLLGWRIAFAVVRALRAKGTGNAILGRGR